MTLKNMFVTFMYLVDIIKDTLQLLLLLTTVGGVSFVLHNWASFSSVVSLHGSAQKTLADRDGFELEFSGSSEPEL